MTVAQPYRDGVKLINFRKERVQIYCDFPDAPPWAAEKSDSVPQWRRNDGGDYLDLAKVLRVVEQYGELKTLAQRDGVELPRKRRAEAYGQWLKVADPASVQEAARFGYRSWPMYNGFRRCEGLLELSQDGGAALAYMLVHGHRFLRPRVQRPLRTARTQVRRRRRDIATRLGFKREYAASAVRMLARMPRESLHPEALKRLRIEVNDMTDRTRKLLAHCDRITPAVVDMLYVPRVAAQVTPGLLGELAHGPHCAEHAWRLADMAHDAMDLALLRNAPLPMLRSVRQIQSFHDAEVARFRLVPPPEQDRPLPPAPVAELPGRIEYIRTTRELGLEGEEMHHCVGGYERRIRRGECFIYRVLQPERATVAIALGPEGRFGVREIRGAYNCYPGVETLETVWRWLATAEILRGLDELVVSERVTVRQPDDDDPFAGEDIPF